MQKSREIKTILVIRSTAMGDVAMTAPVIEQFVAKYPDINLIFLTTARFSPFFTKIKGLRIENVELHGHHAGFWGIVKLFRELSSKYDIDLIIDLQEKLYTLLLKKLYKLFRNVDSVSIDKGKDDRNVVIRRENKVSKQLPKMLYRYVDTFARASFPFEFKEIPYPSERKQIPESFSFLSGNRLIGFSPLASYEGKQLPLRNVRKTIELLIDRYPEHKILIFGGGRFEKMVGTSLEAFYKGRVYSVIGKISLQEEMDLMTNLEVMISMDSSAQHICALLGVNVVSIWGATQPLTGYLGYGYNTDDNVVSLCLPCSPCSVYGNIPCFLESRQCMNGITPDMVASKLAKFIP